MLSVPRKPSPLQMLGERIREMRKFKNLTQEGLALKSDIDRSYLGGVERGERNLSFDKLCQIAQALGCDEAACKRALLTRFRGRLWAFQLVLPVVPARALPAPISQGKSVSAFQRHFVG